MCVCVCTVQAPLTDDVGGLAVDGSPCRSTSAGSRFASVITISSVSECSPVSPV